MFRLPTAVSLNRGGLLSGTLRYFSTSHLREIVTTRVRYRFLPELATDTPSDQVYVLLVHDLC